MREVTEHAWIDAARRGDRLARERLAERWAPLALQWSRRLGGPQVDADDAAHDALLVAFTRLDTLRDPTRANAWLYGIVRRTLAWHRRRAWWGRFLSWTHEPEGPLGNPDEALSASEGAQRVRRVLDELPAIHREVLVLCVIEERPAPEVAEMLGLSEGTVRSRLRLARERVRAMPDGIGLQEVAPC